ncbi:hypothetical protein KW797_00550 [Candidatus Parcubacteria bacterium]|nr:hypothetical protein [Candidatus Parcubacteria bacterium]
MGDREQRQGPLIGIIIIIVLLALGGWYFYKQSGLPGLPGDSQANEATDLTS